MILSEAGGLRHIENARKASGGSDNGFIKFIAYMQAICIVLVVIVHSFREYPYDISNVWAYELIHNILMPSFFFVSGFLLTYTATQKNKGYGQFLKGKATRLLLPFVVLSTITFLPRCLLSFAADNVVTPGFGTYAKSLLYADLLPIRFYWYLQALFILLCSVYLFILIARRLNTSNKVYCILLVAVFTALSFIGIPTTLLSLHKMAALGIFFVLGVAYAEFYNKIERHVPFDNPLFLLASVLVWIVCFSLSEDSAVMQKFYCLAGIVVCISISKMLVKYNVKVLDHLVGATYMIFLLSWFMNKAFQQLLHHYTDFPWQVYTVMSIVAGIYVPVAFYYFLKNHPDSKLANFVLFLLGHPYKRSKSKKSTLPK